MKTTIKMLTMVLAMALLAIQPAGAQIRGLNDLVKKAKDKVNNTATEVEAVNTNAISNQIPWPMSGGLYKEKDPRAFLYDIADVSDEELVQLRDQYLARYKSNLVHISNYDARADQAQQENQNFLRFLYEMNTIVNVNINNVWVSYDGTVDASRAYYLITRRGGGGIGYFVTQKDGKFLFVTKEGDGAFLDADDLAIAKEAAARMRKYQQLTYGLRDVMKTDASNYDANIGAMYDICGLYADAVEKACAGNTAGNIERKPRPAAGALHAEMKAAALAVAKADDPDVVDVIITSGQWDVKMNGAVPVNRNIYGYYIYKDENGLQCYSRMWTEDYQGNGKYGPLRKGGTGAGSPFYIQ